MLKEFSGGVRVRKVEAMQGVYDYAQISWEAVKLGVASGYLPDVELGQDPMDIDDDVGINNKFGFIQERLEASSGEEKVYHCLVLEVEDEVVAGGMISYKPDNDYVCFSSLAVSEEHSGNGYAIALRQASLLFVEERYPNVEYISIGRYPQSVGYTQQKFPEDSYFNQIVRRAERSEEVEWKGETTTFYDIPISEYSRLIHQKAEKYGLLD